MKILFIIDSLREGGSERSLSELLPYLARSGMNPVIICLEEKEPGVQKEVQRQGFDVRFLSRPWLRRIKELRRILKAEKPDVIHTTLFESNVLGRLASVGLPFPVMTSLVNTPYDAARLRDPKTKRGKLRIIQNIDSWTARHLTKHFHAVSETARDAAVRDLRIRPESVTVVERGRDPGRLGEPGVERYLAGRARLGLKEDDEVVVTVGRQDYQKGQWYLLQAACRLITDHPRLVFLIVGRAGNMSNELQIICRTTTMNGAIRLLGNRQDVPDILAAADLFVFPSLYEGLPGALIEAMALGLPVIASDIGPVREIVEADRNALLVPSAAPSLLSDAIETLLKDRDKAREMGKRSREIFEERFTISRSAARMIELYRNVALEGK